MGEGREMGRRGGSGLAFGTCCGTPGGQEEAGKSRRRDYGTPAEVIWESWWQWCGARQREKHHDVLGWLCCAADRRRCGGCVAAVTHLTVAIFPGSSHS